MVPDLNSGADSHTQDTDGSPPTDGVPPSVYVVPNVGTPTPAHASPDAVPSNGDHTSPSRSAEWQLIAVSAKPTVDEPMLDPLSQLPPYQEPQYWP
jgi:hypothetical protein